MKLIKTVKIPIREYSQTLQVQDPKSWGEGEWVNEPGLDVILFYEHKGYECALTRNDVWGTWNGYVAVPKDSHWVKNYGELDVHGGVTWYTDRLPWEKEDGDKFWIGFDTCHYQDYQPLYQATNKFIAKIDPKLAELMSSPMAGWHDKYRTLKYCLNELKKLIKQIQKNHNN